ncbi:TetR/AcrR family transcriptional regulator [Mucilaginibacter psychrotolerans]|uniref:TetR/AcrR family transcriptional regulator n=1 Tax=Mucilaginibacter psychrotolerans TaxID=1524096 RepID=A0A4Y8SDJ9_9SPHI|nr:TetR/AcrR family transcriptional regulator [Mucilaginibacter psychrotolerans]TFF37099.1 TetR/AcrR family transcriptional regulator [Mucilaginibacter psychrotolerans]
MDFQVKFAINEKIFLRNPESSEVGKLMVKKAIDLIYELGFEHFTFKKLAIEIGSTEATIYRYFENKHRLLLYILNWYWCYMEFLVTFKLENLTDKKEQLRVIVHLLTHEFAESTSQFDYNKKYLNQIVISESSKVFLVKEVTEINKDAVFKPYKDLCTKIAAVITSYQPDYQFPRSLSTTLIETAHHQQFFGANLPKLTDISPENKTDFANSFLEDLLFKALG